MTPAGYDTVLPAESGDRLVVSPCRPDARNAVDARRTNRFLEKGTGT